MGIDEEILCPLVKRMIDLPYCYEIGLVIDKLAKPCILHDNIDLSVADKTCKQCEFYDRYNKT